MNSPTWEVWARCVPPQNSAAVARVASVAGSAVPTETTRTGSGYFSPKTARTPSIFIASASGISLAATASSARIRRFTNRSTSASCSAVTALSLEKSNRSRSGSTTLPAWET